MSIWNFLATSVKELLQVIIMVYVVIYAVNGCIFLAIIYPDIVIGNFRKTVHLGVVRIG